MRILITGACGWSAKAIIESLIQAGHEIIGFYLESPFKARFENF